METPRFPKPWVVIAIAVAIVFGIVLLSRTIGCSGQPVDQETDSCLEQHLAGLSVTHDWIITGVDSFPFLYGAVEERMHPRHPVFWYSYIAGQPENVRQRWIEDYESGEWLR